MVCRVWLGIAIVKGTVYSLSVTPDDFETLLQFIPEEFDPVAISNCRSLNFGCEKLVQDFEYAAPGYLATSQGRPNYDFPLPRNFIYGEFDLDQAHQEAIKRNITKSVEPGSGRIDFEIIRAFGPSDFWSALLAAESDEERQLELERGLRFSGMLFSRREAIARFPPLQVALRLPPLSEPHALLCAGESEGALMELAMSVTSRADPSSVAAHVIRSIPERVMPPELREAVIQDCTRLLPPEYGDINLSVPTDKLQALRKAVRAVTQSSGELSRMYSAMIRYNSRTNIVQDEVLFEEVRQVCPDQLMERLEGLLAPEIERSGPSTRSANPLFVRYFSLARRLPEAALLSDFWRSVFSKRWQFITAFENLCRDSLIAAAAFAAAREKSAAERLEFIAAEKTGEAEKFFGLALSHDGISFETFFSLFGRLAGEVSFEFEFDLDLAGFDSLMGFFKDWSTVWDYELGVLSELPFEAASADSDEEPNSKRSRIDQRCSICLETVAKIAAPPCGHSFHRECLLKWRRESSTCPECRRRLPIMKNAPKDLMVSP